MKKNYSISLLIFAVILSLLAFFSNNIQAQTTKFSGVIPFSTAGGLLGFFDQNTGKVYIYDQEYKQCVSIVQLDRLGTPTVNP